MYVTVAQIFHLSARYWSIGLSRREIEVFDPQVSLATEASELQVFDYVKRRRYIY